RCFAPQFGHASAASSGRGHPDHRGEARHLRAAAGRGRVLGCMGPTTNLASVARAYQHPDVAADHGTNGAMDRRHKPEAAAEPADRCAFLTNLRPAKNEPTLWFHGRSPQWDCTLWLERAV